MPESHITARFGASVRSLRYRLGISQEELAGRADLHRTYIAGIERGARNVTLKSIEKLARALEVSTAALLSSAEEPERESTGALLESSSAAMVEFLIAEDPKQNVDRTARGLEKAKLKNPIHNVNDGAEALDFVLSTGRYAGRQSSNANLMVFLDLNLPKVSGKEVIRKIKEDERSRMIPVIVLTMWPGSQEVTESRRLGADAYILKPVDFPKFCEVTSQFDCSWTLLRPNASSR